MPPCGPHTRLLPRAPQRLRHMLCPWLRLEAVALQRAQSSVVPPLNASEFAFLDYLIEGALVSWMLET